MSPPTESPVSKRRVLTVRTVSETIVCLVVLVILFRAFLASGYMIETGSMAPCLYGDHKSAVCPACGHSFAIEARRKAKAAACPNCGRGGIPVESQPRNDGDHLLVYRGAIEFRLPRRWEVVVFRNPNQPSQAYVKRIAGLPGEEVQIIDGDLYVNRAIQAKSYATQRGMRILVYDHDRRPDADDPDWQSRWVADEPGAGWQAEGGTLRFAPASAGQAGKSADAAWFSYRHWVRSGGDHSTSVPLEQWPESVRLPGEGLGPLSYDEQKQSLVCRGALSRELRDRVLNQSDDPEFRRAVERLYEGSHVAPITDEYGYNGPQAAGQANEVRDLMLSARVSLFEGGGQFIIAIGDGREEFHCVFDVPERRIRLIDTRTGKAMRTAPLPEPLLQGGARVELSLMDRQVLLAVDEHLAFEPWSYQAAGRRGSTPWRPVRLGAKDLRVEVSALALYRDVYYTANAGERGVAEPYHLGADEFFVLGDNSPVSKDSRSWSRSTRLSADMLLGKPLIVHLPSRKARFRFAGWQTEFRIPELSRIRYIR